MIGVQPSWEAAMNREYHAWHSPSLERKMELLVFGERGTPVLAFPTCMGRFFDWEDRGMIAALGEQVERGSLQLFTVDSVDAEAWCAPGLGAADRARRHVQYDRYLLTEVVPFVVQRNASSSLIVAGTSFGAYHAVNFSLRYPHLVTRVLGMSGPLNPRHWTDGYSDDNVYFNNPCDFVLHEHEAARLEALRGLDVILAIGHDDPAAPDNRYLAGLLSRQGIPHALHIWDGLAHDWPWWQQMIRLYIGGHD
jgi:esterase/lipase superfamily enzyme